MSHPTSFGPGTKRRINGALFSRYVNLVRTRFPEVREIADELLDSSQTFRALVEEYGMCVEALESFSRNGSDKQVVEQYMALRFDLERALLECIVEQRRTHGLQ
jgi:hypothetical protein